MYMKHIDYIKVKAEGEYVEEYWIWMEALIYR